MCDERVLLVSEYPCERMQAVAVNDSYLRDLNYSEGGNN